MPQKIDLHTLPRLEDSAGFLYLEHCRIEQDDQAIAAWMKDGILEIPCAGLCTLMLGPGTQITQAAITALADNGASIVWVGERGVRTYACATGETRSARNLLHQARLACSEPARLRVVARMYRMRFPTGLRPGLTLRQIRGLEGVRVRESYAAAAREYDVAWTGRDYNRTDWDMSNPVNQALSCATACLYGLCHAAIVSLGYSPGIGFIHTGKQLSFVYDIADLYKTEFAIPPAFEAAAEERQLRASGKTNYPPLERRVRKRLRDLMTERKLLQRAAKDLGHVLSVREEPGTIPDPFADDPARPHTLWNPVAGEDATLPEDEAQEP